MPNQDTRIEIKFQNNFKKEVVGSFDGGSITSDAGGLLLREVERSAGIIERFTTCFSDHRNPDYIEHSVNELLGQRIYGICLGYEDLNDHDTLRVDPLLATLVGKLDPSGADRQRERDKGKALAGKSTLNRLELTPADASGKSRYQKVVYHTEKIETAFIDIFLNAYSEAPESIIMDFDATDDLIHGDQEGSFFHGYYGNYCYLPLYIFCGDFLLAAKLRSSDIDASFGTVDELSRIIPLIRARWPKVKITIRGDSGFCREEIMAWCEQNDVDYLFGLAKNSRLLGAIEKQLKKAGKRYVKTGAAARVFRDFRYQTQKSWSCARRVIGKAEWLEKGPNPRFVVTSLSRGKYPAQALYEKTYCARGDMENRIKEQQLGLFADRTSAETMRANQLRLWFSSIAYVLMNELRRLGLQGTALAKAQVATIREKIFKVGALVKITVRKIWIHFSSAYPYQEVFHRIYDNLKTAYPLRC